MFWLNIIWAALEDKRGIVIASDAGRGDCACSRTWPDFLLRGCFWRMSKRIYGSVYLYSCALHKWKYFVSRCELRSVSLLPGCTAQMVETNWGWGQSLYVFWKSCASLEVEGEAAVAEASSGLMWAMAASLCLPAGHDAKLNGCSSCLIHFSQDKFLHPPIWLNQQKCVCAWRGPILSPAAIPADAEARFGMQISLAVPGLFYIGCLSWACILPVLLQTELWQTASFHLFQVPELWRAGWPQRYAN